MSYDEYGVPGASNVGRFGYTGQAWLPEISLYYYKARIYSPNLGRFLQTDPIGYEAGINWYAYVKNDPMNLVDPTGLAPNDDPAKPPEVDSEQNDPEKQAPDPSRNKPQTPDTNPPPPKKSTVEDKRQEALDAAQRKQDQLEAAAEARLNRDWDAYNTAMENATREEQRYQDATLNLPDGSVKLPQHGGPGGQPGPEPQLDVPPLDIPAPQGPF